MPGEPLAADPDPTEPDSINPDSTEPESKPEAPPSPAKQQPQPPPPPPQASAPASLRPWLGLDRQGLLEALGGTVIALFSSYDHITLADRSIPLQQQWGVWLIAASLALVVVDAELATRSRSREETRRYRDEDYRRRSESRRKREAHEANRERHRAAEERIRADQERERADRARNRAAEAAERQRQGIARLHACALLSGRVQLDPSPINRDRFRAFLAVMAGAGNDR
jgi:hypothetical protein